MSERDSDIEFDFFDEPETEEATQRHPRLPRRPAPRPGGPRRPGGPPRRPIRPAPGVAPLLRLTGLIAFAILIILLLVFAVRRCSAESKAHSYQSYMDQVRRIANSSEQLGREMNDSLTTPGIKERDLENDLSGLAQRQQQDLTKARKLVPPGPLRREHMHLLDALQLREIGLSRLQQTFQRTADSKDAADAGTKLAEQAQLLVASDTIWRVFFLEPTVDELKQQGIGGVNVPDSKFLANPDIASARSMVPVFQRVHGAATGGTPGGLHGTGLVSVKAIPNACTTCADKQTLSTSSANTITASTDLAFAVTVEDTGESQEVQIPVTLTLEASPKPIVLRKTIDLLNPRESKTLTFTDLGSLQFGAKTRLKIDVAPVPAEKTTSNNSAAYDVVFSLG
jgi:hypothetical protein